MANFDDVADKAKEIFGEVSQKTGEFVSVQKMRISIGEMNSKISRLYRRLGELVFSSRADMTDCDDEIDAVIEEIKDKKEVIKTLRLKIDEMKNRRSCPVCGRTNDKDATFCSGCGEKISFYDDEFEDIDDPEQDN